MGQFDQTVDDQGVNLTPVPMLDPMAAAGIPPGLLQVAPPPQAPPPVAMPTPPRAPAQPGNLQHIISMALLGLAAGLGPRHGGAGVAAGLTAGQDANEADRRSLFKDQQGQYREQQQEALRQQGLAQQEQANRLKAYEVRMNQRRQMLESIAKIVPTIKTKEAWDRFMEQSGNTAVQSGFRDLNPLALRSHFTFVAPDQKAVVQQQIMAAMDMAKKLGQDPSEILGGSLNVDLVGDGKPTSYAVKPVRELMGLSGMSVFTDDLGKPLGVMSSEKGSEYQSRLTTKIAMFKADHNGKEPDPKQLDQIKTEASMPVKDPDLAATPDQIDMYATLITRNKMSPSQIQVLAGGMGQQGRAFLRNVTTKALEKDPNFSFEEAESTYQLVKSPLFQNTIRYMDSVVESMPRLQQTANQLGNGNVRSLNALINAAKNQANSVPLKKFKTDVLLLSDEIAKILQGGGTGSGTSDAKLRQAGEILSTSDSPRAIAAALGEAAALIGNRRTALTRGTYLEKPAAAGSDPAAAAKAILDRRQ